MEEMMNPVSASIGIIGGADGPTAIFITGRFPWEILLIGASVIGLTIFLILRRKK